MFVPATQFARLMSATKMESCNKKLPSLLLSILCTLGIASCSASSDRGDVPSRGNPQNVSAVGPENCLDASASVEGDAGGYRIQPGDQLAIDFYLNSEFNDNVSVQPDGRIVLRLVGPLQASGQTPGQL